MLIILQEEFNTAPFYCLDNTIYNHIRDKFIALIHNEMVVDSLLQKYWSYTLRELSCNSMVDIMDCFILL